MCCFRLRILNRAFRSVTTSDVPAIGNDEVQAELAQYDLTAADLRDCRSKPDASQLVVANGAVSRADGSPIGYVDLNTGRSRAVYACKTSLDTEQSCVPKALQTRRVFLLGKKRREEFDPPPVIGMVTRAPFRQQIQPYRPLAAIMKTETGTRHPCDAEVLRTVEMLLG